ncbi:MAG: DUF2012 domain-containing protein, partial [Syntrophobacteraceae bacterium]
ITPEGSLEWKYPANGAVSSSLAIGVDGAVLFGSSDNCIYSVNSSSNDSANPPGAMPQSAERPSGSQPQPGEAAAVANGRIFGKLHVNSATGPPLAGARVHCGGRATTTGTDGSFTIDGIPAGMRTLSFYKAGYRSSSRSVRIIAGRRLNVGDNFVVRSIGGLHGKLHMYSLTGPAFAEARVTLTSVNGSLKKATLTGSDGTYYFHHIPSGRYILNFDKLGFLSLSRRVTIVDGVNTDAGSNRLVLDTHRIKNRQSGKFVHIEYGGVTCGLIQESWLSAQWTLEPVTGTQYYRIRNKWKPDRYLHIETGLLQCTTIEEGWYSAQWTIERVSGTGYHRIRNRWKTDKFLHTRYGPIQCGQIETDWLSAQWTLPRI